MRNASLNRMILLIEMILLFSCNKYKNIHNTSEVIIYSDSLALYSTFDSLIKVENLNSKENLYESKINSDQTIIPKVLLEKYDYLCFTLNDTLLECVNFRNKKKIWNYKCDGIIRSLKNLNDSIVLIGVRDTGLIAVNALNGNKIYQLNDLTSSSCISSSMYDSVYDEKCFFVSDSYCNNAAAYNIENGKNVWRYKFKIDGTTRLLLIKDFIFCGITGNPMKNEGAVVLLDKYSGKAIFEKNEPFDLITRPVLYKNKVIYYTYDSKLNEFDLDTKTTNVIYRFKEGEFGCGNQFFLKDDNIFFDDCKFNLNQFNLKTYKLKVLRKSNSVLLGVYKAKDKIRFLY